MATIAPSNNYTNRYVDNVYFQDGMLLTGILAALLYLILGTALDAAGHVPSMALLLPVTLGAIAMGLLMSYSRFDGFFALSHSMFTGLAWILYLMGGMVKTQEINSFLHYGVPTTQAKIYFVLYRLLTWVDAAWKNEASNDNYMFIFEISFLIWWLTYLGIWAIFRYGYTWRAIIPAGLVLVLNTYYAPNSTLGFLIVFTLLALMLLVRTNLAEQQVRWREESIYFSQDITFDFLRTGLLYSVIVLALAWLAPAVGRNAQIARTIEPISDLWTQMQVRIGKSYEGLNYSKQFTGSSFGKNLQLGGRRNVGSNLVFTVAAPAGRYWRAVVFDTFDGRQWLNTAQDEMKFDANASLPAASWNLRTPITQTIKLYEPTGNVIFGAPDIRQVNLPVSTLVRSKGVSAAATTDTNQSAAQADELTFVRSRQPLDVGDHYTVVSQYTEVTEKALESAGTDYPADIQKIYTQLPENYSPKVKQAARELTNGFTTVYDKAKAVESYLRSNIPYSDTIEAPPATVDPVEYFLFDIKKGYCDYYATAMAVMLRSLGIPARTASGYAEGNYDEDTGVYAVSEQDAHTWVEVYFPSYGWIEFEPTASKNELQRPSGADEADAAAQQHNAAGALSAAEQQQQQQNYPLNQQPEQGSANMSAGNGAATLGGQPWWLWAILTPLLLVLGVWGLRRSRILGPAAFTPELPPIVYERMVGWAERLGLRTVMSDTPFEHAYRFGRLLPEGRSLIQRITEVYVRYCFSPQKMDADVATGASRPGLSGSELGESWQQLQPLLWRSWVRKLTNRFARRKANPFGLADK
jgi:transglutaminase-like putative cysteine protease